MVSVDPNESKGGAEDRNAWEPSRWTERSTSEKHRAFEYWAEESRRRVAGQIEAKDGAEDQVPGVVEADSCSDRARFNDREADRKGCQGKAESWKGNR